MRLKTLAIAAVMGTTVFGGVATADAKPKDKKVKACKQSGKKLRCETTDGEAVVGICQNGYDPILAIEVTPDVQAANLNGNLFLCYSATLGVTDDTPVG